MEWAYLLIGFGLGALLAWLWGREQVAQARQEAQAQAAGPLAEAQAGRQVAEEKNKWFEKNLGEGRAELAELRQSLAAATAQLAGAKAEALHLGQQLGQKDEQLRQLQQTLTAEFKNLANEILEEKGRRFAEQNRTSLAAVLLPLQEKFGEFRQKVEEVYDKEAQQRFSLEREIKGLRELNQQMSHEAHQLATALRGQAKVQGNWGEMVLESILEKSGLVNGREYRVQPSVQTDDHRRLQPDVVICLPEQKYLVVDAKVSLTAYERWHRAEEGAEKDRQLRLLLQSVRQHASDLSSKNYHQLYSPGSPDFVLMFLPVEPAFNLATQHDPDLFQWAFERNVVLVSASTLLATLRTVASIWRQEKQSRNAEEIAREGGLLYDKVVGLLADLRELGNLLGRAQHLHDATLQKMGTGKGNLLGRVEKLRQLGAKASKSLPPDLFTAPED
jgi:DNA recombination protein RmuC